MRRYVLSRILKRYSSQQQDRVKRLLPFEETKTILLFVDSFEDNEAVKLCEWLQTEKKNVRVFFLGRTKTPILRNDFIYVSVPPLFGISACVSSYLKQVETERVDLLIDFTTLFPSFSNLLFTAANASLKLSLDKGESQRADIRFAAAPTLTLQQKFDTAIQCMNLLAKNG